MVGVLTFVIHFASLVGASCGARTRSGPIVPKSPTVAPGQIGKINSASAPLLGAERNVSASAKRKPLERSLLFRLTRIFIPSDIFAPSAGNDLSRGRRCHKLASARSLAGARGSRTKFHCRAGPPLGERGCNVTVI